MGIQVRRNFSLKTLRVTTREDMEAIGRLARERIIRRTVMGQAPGGGAFAPYSPAYAKQKAAETGSAAVNLQLSGEMLRSIQVIAESDTKVRLTFTA